MNDRIAKLIADKIDAMHTANAEHDAKIALAMARDNVDAAREALALVKSPSAPRLYVEVYTDFMLLALTKEG